MNAATQADEHRRALQDLQERELKEKEPAPNGGKGGTKIALSEVLGDWRIDGDDSPFRIVQEDPEADPYRLEAHTADRVWKGEIIQANSGTGRLVFSYKPKAGEMNAQIPSWAREYVDGELEWKIELELDLSCPFWMTGKWYVGEVGWPEGENTQQRQAYVLGRGRRRAGRSQPKPGWI